MRLNDLKQTLQYFCDRLPFEVAYSLSICNQSGEKINICRNDDNVVSTASIRKLFIMIAVLQRADCNKSYLQHRIILNEDNVDKNEIYGLLQYLTYPASVTVYDLLTFMIALSDNVATKLLCDLIGLAEINECIHKLGLFQTHLGCPQISDKINGRDESTTSASDTNILLNLIVQGSLGDFSSISILKCSQTTCQLALTILSRQKSKVSSPFFLSTKKSVICHKTGFKLFQQCSNSLSTAIEPIFKLSII